MAKIDTLNPIVKAKAEELIAGVKEDLGYKIGIVEAERTFDEQDNLYAKGRIPPDKKKIVTNAKGGQSFHNYKIAFDIVIIKADGTYDWKNDKAYIVIGEYGEGQGLEWGGRFRSLKGDLGHFQLTGGYTWRQLLNLYNEGGMELVQERLTDAIQDEVDNV